MLGRKKRKAREILSFVQFAFFSWLKSRMAEHMDRLTFHRRLL